MNNKVKKEIEQLIKELKLNCTVEKFKDKVRWWKISEYQKLSEEFIIEFKDKINWLSISEYQILSKEFIEKFKDKICINFYNSVHQKKTYNQKRKEIREYAKRYNLKFDGKFLYAFRDHDQYGRGLFNKAMFYEKGKYYKDWHCDMRKYTVNSFGLGIFPKGNTQVKIKVSDWGTVAGVAEAHDNGKSRVWGLEII